MVIITAYTYMIISPVSKQMLTNMLRKKYWERDTLKDAVNLIRWSVLSFNNIKQHN